MENKEFIPYEEALALKELGFDEPCLSSFDENKKLFKVWENDIVNGRTICSAPLYQQAFRWFREKYGLYSVIDGLENRQYYKITQLNSYSKEYDTYEEAELACLRKLIQLVKNE